MKPDIVFFGEGLPEIFHESMAKDKDECDLLIVIGSSLKVRPVALIPSRCSLFMVWLYKFSLTPSPDCLQL
jgi:NAD-dependent deacetylase sirtuin 1